MKNFIPILSIFVIVISSCATPATSTSSPTLAPTNTPTSPIQAVLSQAATLYSGPGNVNYESLASLPAGTTVYPSGIYGDFVQATATVAGNDVTSFIWKNALENLPPGLPVLASNQVPLESFFLASCSPAIYNPETDMAVFSETSDIYYGGIERTLDQALRVRIRSFTSTHDWNYIGLNGSSSSLAIMSQKGYQENYVVAIPDRSGTYYIIDLGRNSSLPIQMLFNKDEQGRVTGKSFDLLDENDRFLRTVDLTHTSDGRGLLPDGLFPDGQFNFGVNIHQDSRLIVSGFELGTQPSGRWVNQPDPGPGLYKLAESSNLTVGAGILFDRMIDRRYCLIMQHNFNVATLSDFGYQQLWLGPGSYNWGSMDRAVYFATQHGWKVRGFHLAYGEVWFLPDWILGTNYSPEEAKAMLKQQIHTVIGRFRGKVQEWSLANELTPRIFCPLPIYDGKGRPTKDFWFEKIYGTTGDYNHDYNNYLDYLRMIFGWAREEDPNATLILNDDWDYPPYNPCSDITIRSMHNVVEALNRPGQPKLIDAIGMQMHLNGSNPPSKADLIDTMQYLASAETGARIYITEMDVNLAVLIASHPDRNDRWEMEASIYKDVVEACLESGVCSSFSTWDFYDPFSPAAQFCDRGCSNQPDADPLLFGKDFIPKPAYFAVKDALAGQ